MTIRAWAHFDDVRAADWHWRNFKPAELACRGSGQLMINVEALTALQRLRNDIEAPMIVRSAYRSPAHNARVGGAAGSRHLVAEAFDIAHAGLDVSELLELAVRHGFAGIGRYSDFVHLDRGPAREWWG